MRAFSLVAGFCAAVSVLGVVLIVGAVTAIGRDWYASWCEKVTLSSSSPDGASRVLLVELPTDLDRNFEVRLAANGGGKFTTIFRSPDEGRPVGSERILWSEDGSRFLLLGREFFTPDGAELPNGERLYLLADVRSGRVWCNATQKRDYPTFGLADLAGFQLDR